MIIAALSGSAFLYAAKVSAAINFVAHRCVCARMDSEAAPESIAAPAIANGADGSSQGAGEADPVTNEGSPSDAEIVAKLKEYLADSSMNMNVTGRRG